MRKYERRYFKYGKYDISYLFSPAAQENKNLLFVMPQGRRPAEHFVKNNPGITEEWNVLVVDMPGKGQSKKASQGSELDKLTRVFARLINHEDFDIKDSVFCGKSFNSELAADMGVKLIPRALVIIAGPRLFSPRLARISIKLISLIIALRILRLFSIFVGILLAIKSVLTPNNLPHYKNNDTDQWFLLRDIFRRRLKPMPPTNVKTFLIENGKDELISDKAMEEIKEAFKDHELIYLPTQSHWGPVHSKEVTFINQSLKSL